MSETLYFNQKGTNWKATWEDENYPENPREYKIRLYIELKTIATKMTELRNTFLKKEETVINLHRKCNKNYI